MSDIIIRIKYIKQIAKKNIQIGEREAKTTVRKEFQFFLRH
jgi:hypothetical protein